MQLDFADRGLPDTRLIERFLLSLNGVLYAKAWERHGQILASVTVLEDAHCDDTGLQEACMAELGPSLTPALIMIERAMRPAA